MTIEMQSMTNDACRDVVKESLDERCHGDRRDSTT